MPIRARLDKEDRQEQPDDDGNQNQSYYWTHQLMTPALESTSRRASFHSRSGLTESVLSWTDCLRGRAKYATQTMVAQKPAVRRPQFTISFDAIPQVRTANAPDSRVP